MKNNRYLVYISIVYWYISACCFISQCHCHFHLKDLLVIYLTQSSRDIKRDVARGIKISTLTSWISNTLTKTTLEIENTYCVYCCWKNLFQSVSAVVIVNMWCVKTRETFNVQNAIHQFVFFFFTQRRKWCEKSLKLKPKIWLSNHVHH